MGELHATKQQKISLDIMPLMDEGYTMEQIEESLAVIHYMHTPDGVVN